MTIYKITAKVERKRFMESPLHFAQELNVIADSVDQAIDYVKQRFPERDDQKVSIFVDSTQYIYALFDARMSEERVIV